MHIPDDPAFYEKFYFTPGDLAIKFQNKICQFWCVDLLGPVVPEAARITALMGAEILFYPRHRLVNRTGPAHQHRTIQCLQTIQRSHAIANGVHVVSVNRTGYEQDGAMKFWGGSLSAIRLALSCTRPRSKKRK